MNAREGKPIKENVVCHGQQGPRDPTGMGHVTCQTHLFISDKKSSLDPEIKLSKVSW